MSESSCSGNYTGGFRFDVGDDGDWVRHCHRLACTGELLLCSAANVASCALWFWIRDYLAIVVSLLSASLALASFALESIPIHLLDSVASA